MELWPKAIFIMPFKVISLARNTITDTMLIMIYRVGVILHFKAKVHRRSCSMDDLENLECNCIEEEEAEETLNDAYLWNCGNMRLLLRKTTGYNF